METVRKLDKNYVVLFLILPGSFLGGGGGYATLIHKKGDC